MRKFPAPIHQAVSALSRLPGVGPKTALRYTFTLLRMKQHEREQFARAIVDLQHIQTCSSCFAFSEEPVCAICTDNTRSQETLCIVAESRDISTMEAAGVHQGKYFVLGGVLNPIDGQTPDVLHMKALLTRIENDKPKEVVLAFSPDVHGETTMLYLARKLKRDQLRITRLARGLPIGADLEYTDEVTLGDAFLGRNEI